MPAGAVRDRLAALLQLRAGEWPALIWAFLYFFFLLAAYYVLRPLRESMGVAAGVENLQWLFTGTFIVMLLAVPIFGAAAARWSRPTLVLGVYAFFGVNILVFFGLFSLFGDARWLASAFFIWVSVFNLFVVSVFWSLLVDLFSRDQARRLFGVIAAGGTAGAVAGPMLTALLVEKLGRINLLPLSALLLGGALLCVVRLLSWKRRTGGVATAGGAPLGGGVLAGIRLVIGSPYLLGVCALMFLYSLMTTVLYFEQANLVDQYIESGAAQTRYFASIDLAVNLLAILTQLFITGRLVTRFGLRISLVVVPALLVLTLGALAVWTSLALAGIAMVLVRAGTFAVFKPGQELLFTVVSREAKYKAKSFIDTVAYRGGDALSGWLFTGFTSLGLSLGAVAAGAVPGAIVWGWLARRLGKVADAARSDASMQAEKSGDLAGDLRR